MNMIATVTGAWNAFATKIGAFLPNFFTASVILVFGWIGCNIVKRIIVRALRLVQFDSLATRAGISQFLERGGIRQSSSEILGLLAFWFLFLIVVVATLETLGLSGAMETLNTIYLYIPKVVAAIVILILGLYLASFVETVTRTSCANAGLAQADSIGRATYYATTVFIVAAILEILDIASVIVIWAFVLIFGSICLALAIAFGLGGKEVAARCLEKWLEDRRRSE